MNEKVDRVIVAIAAKLAPAIDVRAPYAKVMFEEAARAAIEAHREALAESRLVIVPREPTAAMIDRARASLDNQLPFPDEVVGAARARHISMHRLWGAFIDAAPADD